MSIGGCDFTRDQVRELKLRFELSDLRPAAITDWIR